MQPLWMLASSFLFALMALIVKLTAADVGALALIAWRGGIGLAIIGGWVFATGRSLRTAMLWGHFKRSFLGTASMVLWFVSVMHLPLAVSTTLNYTSPLFMACIALGLAAVRRQPLEWTLGFATVLGFAGVLLVMHPDTTGTDLTYSLIGLLSGVGAALTYRQVRELTEFKEPTYRIVFYFLCANLLFGVTGHLLFEEASQYDFRSTVGVLGVGLTATAAQVCLTRSYTGGNVILSSIFNYSGIIFGAFFGWMVYGESLDALAFFGICVIIAAGVWGSWSNARAGKAAAAKAAEIRASQAARPKKPAS